MNKEDELIRKVLDLTQTEVFECCGILASRTSDAGVPLAVVNPIPVFSSDFSGRIGFAMVDPNTREVQIFLTKACPERLDIENGIKHFVEIKSGEWNFGPSGPVSWSVLEVRLVPVHTLPYGSICPSSVSKGSF